jgi:hypothetical protein
LDMMSDGYESNAFIRQWNSITTSIAKRHHVIWWLVRHGIH